ncbi:2-methylaconitate cis-trans isomerase PrpF family protein [Rhodococcus sp. NCIMB 12038]|uniref:2-methylaconitate cis-trans isomerase PrpF family protein n=1 Tax=Rhodococcus sp. NCIMB 12038 TaxID=933800 RepID=UPI000B3D3513|nr:PrpF domain-containing protein [Rhodococcus sp. NCIMB 12038]OUS92172.1 PrpF family protein [Rhodococcus sp. NCIMB 12038]
MYTDYRAAFIRGGTSKALVFHERDLPADRAQRDALFLRAMGSPDPHGRQLDGMGGGLSSLSKVCIVGPPSVAGADVDYTFAQVQIDRRAVDYVGNCGNMASAIGPFAVDEGLVAAEDGNATVRIHNVNTGKVIASSFDVKAGRAIEQGDYTIHGVAGTGAPIRLDFLDPGGAGTGSLLPTGHSTDDLVVDGAPAVSASLVDAGNPVVFVDAAAVGLNGTELPETIDVDDLLMTRLEAIRRAGSVRMGLAADERSAAQNRMTPFIALVAAPRSYTTLAGDRVDESDVDLTVRFLSNGKAHRALPLTGALCAAVAAQLPDSVVHRHARTPQDGAPIRLGSPSGLLEVNASVADKGPNAPVWCEFGTIYRTTRRLFTGWVRA